MKKPDTAFFRLTCWSWPCRSYHSLPISLDGKAGTRAKTQNSVEPDDHSLARKDAFVGRCKRDQKLERLGPSRRSEMYLRYLFVEYLSWDVLAEGLEWCTSVLES